MPKSWTNKEERMYKHIVDSEKDEGASTRRAKEIAARTVNKTRRERGETANKRTKGTGNPRTALEEHTRDELYNEAKQMHIHGRSGMTKQELIAAIRDH